MSSSLSRRQFIQAAAAGAGALQIEANAQASPPSAVNEGRLRLNEQDRVFDKSDPQLLSSWLRNKMGLTGCKEACGQGVCGACTVLVDGKPIVSCLTPMYRANGKRIQTIEAYEDHPVQRAFAALDGLQCGYCTPGFIVEAIAFVDSWRQANGNAPPDRANVVEAMAGHICRCGAYEGIYQAILMACQGKYDDAMSVPPRAEAWEKVTGRALYTTDIMLPDMLHGVVLRSPHAHAVIQSLPLESLKSPLVHGLVVLAKEGAVLRYVGQPILAIACEDLKAGRDLLRQFEMVCDVLPHVLDIESAMKPDAQRVYSVSGFKLGSDGSEQPTGLSNWSGNVRGPSRLDMFCNPRSAREKIDRDAKSFKGVFSSHVQSHCALEPHCAVAQWRNDGGLNVWLSTQIYDTAHSELAKRFDLKPNALDLRSTHVGGGFGAKGSVQHEATLAIELAQQSMRPVKMVWTRSEELVVGGQRSCSNIHLELSGDARKLHALSFKSWNGSGVSVGGAAGMQARLLYSKADKEIVDYDVVTHAATARAFRGPGAPGALWALEQGVDDMAIRLNMDPIQLRMKWDSEPALHRLGAWALDHPIWKRRTVTSKGRYRRGVGAATGAWAYMLNPKTELELSVDLNGDLEACMRSQDIGTGSRSVIQWTLAKAFGISRTRIHVKLGEGGSALGPGSVGSQTTASVQPAAQNAADRLKQKIQKRLGRRMQPVRLVHGELLRNGKPMSWDEAFKQTGPLSVMGLRPRDPDGYLLRFGPFAIGYAVSRCLQLYEVEVDMLTGLLRVTQGAIGISAGPIVCEPLARSQAIGGMIQGISYALYERRRLDPITGRPVSVDLNHYKIAGMEDGLNLDAHFDQEPLPRLNSGICGISELCTVASAAALGNAVYNATAKRAVDLPLTPESILGLLQ